MIAVSLFKSITYKLGKESDTLNLTQRAGLLLILLLSLGAIGMTQNDPGAGISPFSTQLGGAYDSIDAATSRIMVTIPVRQKAGKIPFSFSLVANYHASLGPGARPEWGYNSSLTGNAFSAALGAFVTTQKGAWTNCTVGQYIVVKDATGAIHPVMCSTAVPLNMPTLDGSGYTVSFQTVNGSLQYLLWDRSGNQLTQQTVTQPAGAGTLVIGNTLTDPDGVSINESLGVTDILGYYEYTGVNTYTDTLGTTALTTTNLPQPSGSAKPPDTYAYTDANGNTQSVTVNYENYATAVAFGCNLPIPDNPPGSTDLPISVVMPDGSTYSITYEQTPGNASAVTGRIASLTLSTGGSITYAYSGGSNGINCQDGTIPLLTRTVNDGMGTVAIWKYTNSGCPGGSGLNCQTDISTTTATVTDPENNETDYVFYGEYQTEKLVYQGAASSQNILSTDITCYNGNFCVGGGYSPSFYDPMNPKPISQTDVYHYTGATSSLNSTTSLSSLVSTKLDAYGLATEIRKYTDVTKPPVSDETVSTFSCTPDFYIEDHSCIDTVVDATGKTVSTVNVTYNAGGHPIQVSRLVNGSNYLTAYASYNTNGTLATSTDPNGSVRQYFYNGTGGCNGLFQTSTQYPAVNGGQLSTSQTWNCNGGVITASTDENGLTTKTAYVNPANDIADPFWRSVTVTDPSNHVTTNTYSPTTIESTMLFNSNASTVDILTTLDGLGRPYLTQERQGPGLQNFDTVTTTYDSDGRQYSISRPCVSTARVPCPVNTPATMTTYDALGRPLVITDNDGGTLSYSYAGNDVIEVLASNQNQANAKTKQLEYDGLGRLTSVCEVTGAAGSGICGQNVSATGYWTKYTYDVLSDITSVTQDAQNAGSIQTRTYTYDGLGRLTSENNPESGTATYAYDSDSTCGTSNGDQVKIIDAVGNITCRAYDALHRPISITYSGPYAGATPSKTFLYDTTTFSCPAGAHVAGKLAEARTLANGVLKTDLAYCYSLVGKVTDVYESTPNSGGYFHTTASYYANGALSTLGGVPGQDTWTYTVDGEGRPYTAVSANGTNLVTSTTYNAASLPHSVVLGSGDSDAYTYDNAERMNYYQFSVGNPAKTDTGILTWNAQGTLGSLSITDELNSANTQTCNYAYDDLARISSVNCPSVWSQTFTFDPFGNISKSGSSSFLPGYSAATNQITSVPGAPNATYDANGNMLTITDSSAHTYAWDVDGNLQSADTITLKSDAFDRPIEKNVSGTFTQVLYSPIGKLATMSGQSSKNIYLPLPGGEQAHYITPSGHYFRHTDWLGTSRLVSDADQNMYFDVAMAPYGEDYADSGTTDLMFTGQDKNTISTYPGLYDSTYRRYSALEGRWISADPAGLGAANPVNPQSWNRYAYMLGNPLNGIDPTGLDDCDPNQVVCANLFWFSSDPNTINSNWSFNGDSGFDSSTFDPWYGNTMAPAVFYNPIFISAANTMNTLTVAAGVIATGGVGGALMSSPVLAGLGSAAYANYAIYGAPVVTGLACAEFCAGTGGAAVLVPEGEDAATATTGLSVSRQWPEYDGFLGNFQQTETAQEGQILSRIGNEAGRYVSTQGTGLRSRGLPSDYPFPEETLWEVVKPFSMKAGIAAPWRGAAGLGVQYKLPQTVDELYKTGYIRPFIVK